MKNRLPDMNYEEAEKLIEHTDYMFMAVQMPGNKINKADAAAFFWEGYRCAQKREHNDLPQEPEQEKPSGPQPIFEMDGYGAQRFVGYTEDKR
jgi:hypothetical protein